MDPILLATLIVGIPLLLQKKKTSTISTIKGTPFPKGRGLFVSFKDVTSLEELFKNIKELNIQWIIVPSHIQQDLPDNGVKTEKLIIDEQIGWLGYLASKGIKIWLFAKPSAYDIDNFIKLCKKFELSKSVSGYVLGIDHFFFKIPNAGKVLASQARKNLVKPLGIYNDSSLGLEFFTNFNFSVSSIALDNGINKQEIENWKNYFEIIIPFWSRHKSITLDEIIKATPSAPGYMFSYIEIKSVPGMFEFVKNFYWDKLQNGIGS